MSLEIVLFAICILVYIVAIDRLVLGAGTLARRNGVSIFMVGLGAAASITSLPEVLVAVRTAQLGSPTIGIESAIASNSVNIGLALGVTLMLSKFSRLTLFEDLQKVSFALLAVTVLLISLMLDNQLNRIDGIVLVVGWIILIVWIFRIGISEGPIQTEYDAKFGARESSAAALLNIVGGVTFCILASILMDAIVTSIAGSAGLEYVSGAVSSVVIIPLLTSVPEILICIVCALRGEYSFAMAVVIGSNMTNTALGIGASSIIQPTGIPPSVLSLHVFVMVAFTLVLLAMLYEYEPRKHRLMTNTEGGALVLAYVSYAAYVVSQNQIFTV